jgi:hemoglobin-like flavoprotein
MRKYLKGNVDKKQISKDIILMRETLTYLEGIRRLSRSKNNFATNHDLLASASFQLLQVSKNLKDVSKEVLELLPSIDTITLDSWCKNLIWNYFQINHTMLIAYLKDISKDAIQNEINAACKVAYRTRARMMHKSKKKQKHIAA